MENRMGSKTVCLMLAFALGFPVILAFSLVPATQAEAAGADSGGLVGAEWRLTGMTFDGAQTALAPDTPVTIRFESSGRVSGRAPVNRFFGGYRLGADGSISWSDSGLATTKMAGPPDEMQREDLFLQILGQVTRVRVQGAQLVLESTDSDTSLTFERQEH
jgi:heat shock protein HslJ